MSVPQIVGLVVRTERIANRKNYRVYRTKTYLSRGKPLRIHGIPNIFSGTECAVRTTTGCLCQVCPGGIYCLSIYGEA